jgi:DNA polymerase-3 subunit delta'
VKLVSARELARRGELYPGVILHGSGAEQRVEAALELARTLLCAEAAEHRPCGRCIHCRRIVAPDDDSGRFHPDFLVLERDLKTSTSAEATRTLLRSVQQRPFEARGQVFLVVSAETLTGGAANALLKNLEEPPTSAPRHFLLLAPSSVDLLPTLRSRSLAIYLGADLAQELDAEQVDSLRRTLAEWIRSRNAALLLSLADQLAAGGAQNDPRSAAPWTLAARCLVELSRDDELEAEVRRALLGLAEELLLATDLRSRGIPAPRLLEGMVSRHLGGRMIGV